jgi:hypothetical protein
MSADHTQSDIDIDLPSRDRLLSLIDVTAARLGAGTRKHNSGVYPTDIPYDPIIDAAAIDYKSAEARGYYKLDLLNMSVYEPVRDEAHLLSLMREPQWSKLSNREFFEQLVHIGNHYDVMCRMPEPIDSIPRMAMFLAVFRPGKSHLIGQPWSEVSKSIWDRGGDGGYSFRKAHAVAYAHMVVVQMNLLGDGVTFV